MANMIPHQLPPTLEQRRALADCLAKANPRHELTFGERRDAIREYREASWSDDYGHAATNPEHVELAKPYTGPFVTAYLNSLSLAEREALRANGEPAELSAWRMVKDECRTSWQYIVEDYREHPVRVTASLLTLFVLAGIGLVWIAVSNGWIQ